MFPPLPPLPPPKMKKQTWPLAASVKAVVSRATAAEPSIRDIGARAAPIQKPKCTLLVATTVATLVEETKC